MAQLLVAFLQNLEDYSVVYQSIQKQTNNLLIFALLFQKEWMRPQLSPMWVKTLKVKPNNSFVLRVVLVEPHKLLERTFKVKLPELPGPFLPVFNLSQQATIPLLLRQQQHPQQQPPRPPARPQGKKQQRVNSRWQQPIKQTGAIHVGPTQRHAGCWRGGDPNWLGGGWRSAWRRRTNASGRYDVRLDLRFSWCARDAPTCILKECGVGGSAAYRCSSNQGR